MSQTLTEKTISGLNWSFAKTYIKQILSIFVGIILARIIPPAEFGLLGMTIIFTGMADLFFTLGIGSSIIKIKDLNDDHIKTGNTITIILSITVCIIFFLTSHLIASFFNENRLILIIKVFSFLFILKGVTTSSYGLIIRELNFKAVFKIEVISYTGYAILSIILAILGYGVWSLVIGEIFSSAIGAILMFYYSPVSIFFFFPYFKKKEFKDLTGFGTGITLGKILQYGANNVDYLIIGKFLNPYDLGLYTKAFNLMTLPINQISSTLYSVLFPAYSAVQNETEKLRTAYLRTIKTITFFVLPLLAGMAVCARYVILGLYGPNWEGSIMVFRILCIGGILRATIGYSNAVASATGRVYIASGLQLVYLLILGGGAYYAVRYGIEGVGAAVVIALIWMFFAQSLLAIKIVRSNWKEFLNTIKAGIINMIIVGLLDLIIIQIIQNYLLGIPEEIKLSIAVTINFLAIISIIFFMPEKIKGDTITWLFEKYKRKIPSKIKNTYYMFNPESLS